MRVRQIHVRATTTAPPERVFALLLDGSTWPRWAPIDSLEVERGGSGQPEGVGTVHVIRRGRVAGRDEIVEVVPGRRLRYVSRSGLPVRDYMGEVDLEAIAGGGTAIDWQSSFVPQRPGTGWLLERGIQRFLDRCASGLARYAASAGDERGP